MDDEMTEFPRTPDAGGEQELVQRNEARRRAGGYSELRRTPEAGGEYELEERQALRRVAGLSTELEDISEVEYRQLRMERVVLVGVWNSGTAAHAEASPRDL